MMALLVAAGLHLSVAGLKGGGAGVSMSSHCALLLNLLKYNVNMAPSGMHETILMYICQFDRLEYSAPFSIHCCFEW
jgi:hypothetical protein